MTETQIETIKERWRKPTEVTMRIAVPTLLGAVSWLLLSLDDVRQRVTIIEASRYTAQDAANDRAKLTAAINSLEVDAAAATSAAREAKERLVRVEEKIDRLLERN